MKRVVFKAIHKSSILGFLLAFICLIGAFVAIPPKVKEVFSEKKISQNELNTTEKISQNERKLPIYCVETPQNRVSISFDAAWGADDTDELLRILADNDVKTTFFMCGYWVDDYPEEVKKIAEAGHDLGNHSATHPHMSQLSKEEIKKELNAAHNKVKELTGVEMNLFRPPFGEYDNKVIEAAGEIGYYTIQWDVDNLDIE